MPTRSSSCTARRIKRTSARPRSRSDRLEQQRTRAEDLRRELQDWIEDRKEHTQEAIASWKQKREIRHLEKRADRAEEHAVNSVLLAMLDADEAELAVIDAIEARLDAADATR